MSVHIKAPYEYREHTVESQRFSEDYFSGADVNIYFGDVWVDEVTSIELAVQENVQPIYGYASYTVEAWARGTRLVTGAFRINFKESYYLHAIINRLAGRGGKVALRTDEGKLSHPHTIEETISYLNTHSDHRDFERVALAYQNAIWGNIHDPEDPAHNKLRTQEHDSYFYPSANKEIRKNGFNILINYGGPIEETYRHMVQGHRERPHALGSSSNTIKSITGVQIANCTQIIDGSGQPIEEEYTFIAKDIDYKIK